MNDAAADANRPAGALQTAAVDNGAPQSHGVQERGHSDFSRIVDVLPNPLLIQENDISLARHDLLPSSHSRYQRRPSVHDIPARLLDPAEELLEGLGVVPADTLQRYVRVGNSNCPICHDDLLQAPASAMPCHHVFHTACLRPWLARRTTCPTCRFDIDPYFLTLTNLDSHSPVVNRLSTTASLRRRPFEFNADSDDDNDSEFWAPRLPVRTRVYTNAPRGRSASPPRRGGTMLPAASTANSAAQPAIDKPSASQLRGTSIQPALGGMDAEHDEATLPSPVHHGATVHDLLIADYFVRPFFHRVDEPDPFSDTDDEDDMDRDREDNDVRSDGSGSEDLFGDLQIGRYYHDDISTTDAVYSSDDYNDSGDDISSLRPWVCPQPIGGFTLVQWIERRERSPALGMLAEDEHGAMM